MTRPEPLPDPIETPAGGSLRDLVRNAVIWRSGTQIVGQIVAWASTFFVIRILAPADYGLVAMTGVVSLLLSLVNGYGFANAVIQRKEVTPRTFRQLLGILLITNGLLALAQIAAAPFAAEYFNEPKVADLLRVQALLHPTTPFIVVAYAMLSRRMDFKRQAQVNLASAFVAAIVAIAGALAGWGVWTLVVAPLCGLYLRAIGLTLAARSLILPSFDFRGAGYIARYGGLVLATQFLWFIQTQSDIFIVGRQYSAAELGIYSTALFLTQVFATKVVPPLNEVAFSAYSRIKDENESAIAPAFLRSIQMVMLIGLPVFAGFATTAEPLVVAVLGEKWAPSAPFVILLAIAMPMKVLLTLFAPASNAIDRPDIPMRNALVGAVILPVTFLVSLRWGLIGVGYGWIAGYSLLALIAARWTFPSLGVSFADAARAMAPSIAGAATMAIVVLTIDHLLPELGSWPRLAILVIAGVVSYAAFLLIFARRVTLEVVALVLRRSPPAVA